MIGRLFDKAKKEYSTELFYISRTGRVCVFDGLALVPLDPGRYSLEYSSGKCDDSDDLEGRDDCETIHDNDIVKVVYEDMIGIMREEIGWVSLYLGDWYVCFRNGWDIPLEAFTEDDGNRISVIGNMNFDAEKYESGDLPLVGEPENKESEIA